MLPFVSEGIKIMDCKSDFIAVSIICNAYNHELYIRDALESFVMQRTSFTFEVLVHDDASTDKTADIIREYEAKYPDIIKPIYQTENQYTKGGVTRFQEPRIKGKYVAFCEGDDYWTDPYKLQKQYDVMEAHPEVDICAHSAIKINAENKQQIAVIAPRNKDCIISTEDVIYGEGGFVATNSLFYRAELYSKNYEFRKILRLDYTLQILGSLRGGMLYLSDYMSAYRYMVPGSWTSNYVKDEKKQEALFEKKQKMLDSLNRETAYKYGNIIKKRMLKNEAARLIEKNELKEVLKKKYREVLKDYSFIFRLKLLLKAYFPFLVTLKNKLRK